MIALAENSYGKSSVRVMKVKRDRPLHTVKEWKVEVLLSGDFETCFTAGDNSEILPTDTMKNTVYSRARESKAECMEDFARELASTFFLAIPRWRSAAINIAGTTWEHAVVAGQAASFDLSPRHRASRKPRRLRVHRAARPSVTLGIGGSGGARRQPTRVSRDLSATR